MLSGFKIFNPSTGAISVSFANYGISFSKGAIECLKRPEYIIFAYDQKNKLVGVKPVKEDPMKIPFIKKEKNSYVRINNKSFIRQIEAACEMNLSDKVTRYFSYWDEKEEMLIVDFKRPLNGCE